MTTTRIQPYLFMGGRCEEAIDFYRTALGAEVEVMMRYADSPLPEPSYPLPPGWERKIMHASLRVGAATFMASDGRGEPPVFAGFSLSLSVTADAEVDRTAAALAAGGEMVTAPMRTFWSSRFAMVRDRFGVLWMVSVPPANAPAAQEAGLRELTFTRDFAAPAESLFRAWTDPAQMVKWFTPAPWSTVRAETDVRPGGSSLVVMRSPDGREFPHRGVYLEVVPNRRLVFTDAFERAWEPSGKAFMTVTLTFEPLPGPGARTRYTASARHWSAEDRAAHEAMGFHAGWAKAAEQLAALVEPAR